MPYCCLSTGTVRCTAEVTNLDGRETGNAHNMRVDRPVGNT